MPPAATAAYLTLSDGQTRRLRDDIHLEVLPSGVLLLAEIAGYEERPSGPLLYFDETSERTWLAQGEWNRLENRRSE